MATSTVKANRGSRERHGGAPRTRAWLLAVFGGILLGFFVGRTSAPRAQTSVSTQKPNQSSIADSPHANQLRSIAPTIERPFLVRPADICIVKDDAAAAQYRAQQSKDLLNVLHVRVLQSRLADPTPTGTNPEASANEAALYVSGWIDGVIRTAPDLIEDLAAGIDERMCSPKTSAAELIVLSRLISSVPDFANPKGLDCLFSQHQEEDAVLWSALDAWRSTNLPRTQAMAAIERTATDPRTLERLLSREEQMERRKNMLQAATEPSPYSGATIDRR